MTLPKIFYAAPTENLALPHIWPIQHIHRLKFHSTMDPTPPITAVHLVLPVNLWNLPSHPVKKAIFKNNQRNPHELSWKPPTCTSIYSQAHPHSLTIFKESEMASLWKSKEVMSRPKPNDKCKKHPKHKQAPGVCALCLSERLSQLSTGSSRRTSTTAGSSCCSSSLSSVSSYYSSSSASTCSSPTMHRSTASISFLLSGKNVLTKSRSLAFAPRIKSGVDNDNNKKKKGGFWSNLLRPRTKRKEESLMHSRTMREMVNA